MVYLPLNVKGKYGRLSPLFL